MTSTHEETRYHIILPRNDGASVLALKSDGQYRLPGWSSNNPAFWQETHAVNQGVLEQLGLAVATLRACRLDWTGDTRDSYYVVESLNPDWRQPPAADWIDAKAAAQINWQSQKEREVLLEWVANGDSPGRVAWYRPGWFVSASDWIERSTRAAGISQAGDTEQLRSWERSSVMRIGTDAGHLYFKAVARGWAHEPALTGYLAGRFPDLAPAIVVAEPESGRMLLHEFPGVALPGSGSLEYWEAAYAALGRIQRELVATVSDLEALGVPVRDLSAIEAEIPAVLCDERRMRAGQVDGLSVAEIASLQAAETRLTEACERLLSGPIPLSLDHGDFWPGNVYASPEKITLFDWSDASITHPFFSLVMAEEEIANGLSGVPDAARRVIDVYLGEWTMYAPLEELREVFSDAMLIAPLHQAMMYRSIYLPAMEFGDELDRMAPHFLRWLAGRV